VVWSTIIGILPLAFITIVISIRPALEVPGEKLAFLPLVLVPVAFGHAIVRYGLFDLEIVIKRSLVYTLLIAVLASVYFAVVYGIGRMVSRFAGSGDLPFSLISIFVITLLISPVRARIRFAVDRMFFRQEYNYRKVLKQISHSLAGIIGLESLVSYLGVRVPEVLKARTGVVFLLDEKSGRHMPRYGYRVDHAMLKDFEADGTLCTHLTRTHATFNVERRLASNRPLPIAPSEAEILLRAESALVVPFIFKSKLLGFISIGRKESDEIYSVTDIELLETLCDQVSLAVENANLYLETVEKQKMEQELEVAREIQHRLLPKTFPKIDGLETHAVNIPSKHVGGDYFDVIPFGNEKVAMVIADVSGKGVPAALLMASLQSSLRAEADVGRQPSEVISAVNRVIFEHTAGGTFVTIFYGVLDLAKASLTYCNAGHPPPLVLDARGGIRELDGTDIVIGIDDTASYRDTEAEIAAGDKIFLYTDGITDELNEEDEPYGEKRLITVLRENHKSGLQDIVESVHKSVLQFTGGKPQDDLTALAVRITRIAFCNEDTSSSANPRAIRKS
jgi:sigma-B regulation protein RsbU (phosphoserine phosphatase)